MVNSSVHDRLDSHCGAWEVWQLPDTARVEQLRQCVRAAMDRPPADWICPAQIDDRFMTEPLAVRKARAIALKLSAMPPDLWTGQLLAGSMTLEEPRVHAERGFPEYTTAAERAAAERQGLTIRSVFGHVVPDYPTLLTKGLSGIRADADAQRCHVANAQESAFLDSVVVAVDAVIAYADRLACHHLALARSCNDATRAGELRQMADNLRQAPAGPAETFWQALQSVWLLHMIFHATMNGNAAGRVDQYAWPLLAADLKSGRLTLAAAAELVDCFTLKFNERAKTTDEQRPDARTDEQDAPTSRTRHGTSSQVGGVRARLSEAA